MQFEKKKKKKKKKKNTIRKNFFFFASLILTIDETWLFMFSSKEMKEDYIIKDILASRCTQATIFVKMEVSFKSRNTKF